MNYEELENSISKLLANSGFKRVDNVFSKQTKVKTGAVVINGQQQVQYESINIVVECLGEGSIDDDVLVGYKLIINDEEQGDFWVDSLETFKQFVSI